MCGIIGYIGRNEAAPILLKGLKNLEYRGYDSVGMATLDDSLRLFRFRAVGKLEQATQNLDLKEMPGNVGMGHTRWATHGSVTESNAHPHIDCRNEIVIVHNGIIENYRELKDWLSARGHNFSSSTDSEVIAHLIEQYLIEAGSFEQAFMEALARLDGSYAILAIFGDEKKILAARKDSPLVIGLSDDGTYFASDVSALLDWTKSVVFLQNYDVVVAERDSIRFYNLLQEGEIEREAYNVMWDAEQAKKGQFEHFMLKEISEQAETIYRAIQQDKEVVQDILEKVRKAKGVFFVGCGSSYNACLAGSYLFSRVAGIHVNLALASEFENYRHFLTQDTLVFAISQSGETADVLDAVRAARRQGAQVIAITNVVGSSLTREGDMMLLMNSGPEICVLSTKTYTSQVVLMAFLAYCLVGRGEECIRSIKDLYMDIYNLTSKSMRDELRGLAELLAGREHMFMIGRGLQYATAMEAALKVKEVSYIHTEAFAGGELKHGPLALIDIDTPVFVF
ncbi:MAG: glutamine--fructose-6-phosphate transaminase (isomerizing), partial [Methanotrichaceae archaeon]|nr:glutamine--fructose-6-phosphate transaminase (isomerizing) [Methanotrichaceae archaeon]